MNLRLQVLRGSVYLVLRQALGIIVGSVGVWLLTRTIGPKAYGQFAAAFSIYSYLFTIGQLGINVYLIRRAGDIAEAVYHQAFTLLAAIALGGALLAIGSAQLIEGFIRVEHFAPVACALFVGLPAQLLCIVPMARVERTLDYRPIAFIELTGRCVCYAVALPMAFAGFGVWSAVAGWWAEQLVVLVGIYAKTGYRPRFHWDRTLAREMTAYGLQYSAASWLWNMQSLINPIVVGRTLGAEAVGQVALAIKISEVLNFVKFATWRLSVAALARLRESPAQLASAINEGMRLQLLTSGPMLLAFAWVSPLAIPWLFGERWMPVIDVYPFVALGAVSSAAMSLHSSALYVVRRNLEVGLFNLAYVALVAGGALFALTRWGLPLYGCGYVLALLSFGIIHAAAARHIGRLDYRLAVLWWIGLALPLFWRQAGMWTAAAPLIALCWPGTLKEIRRYAGEFLKLKSARQPSTT